MSQIDTKKNQEGRDFFVSYTGSDRQWAEWIAMQLEQDEKYTVFIQAWDFRPGSNFVVEMDRAAQCAERTLLVLSPAYLESCQKSGYTQAEWAAAFRNDPAGANRRLVPVRIQPCAVNGLLGSVVYIDLVSLDEALARERLLTGVQQGRAKPATAAFPGQHILRESPASVAFPGSLPAIWNIPYPRNPLFVGRDTELALVRHYLQRDQTTALSQPLGIIGLGGIGKTQIAVEYAYRNYQDYQAVLWTSADTYESLISGYVDIAGWLNLPERNEQDQALMVKAVQKWLITHTQWLLILDNADELTVLREFLPSVVRGHVLLTTRAQATGTLASRIEVETMDREESILFLLRRAKALEPNVPLSEAKQQDYAAAKVIVEAADGFPLALDQVGAYIEETGMSLSNYLKLREDVLAREGRFSKDHPEYIVTSWSLSFREIKRTNPAAAELLCFCAFLAPDAIPETFIREGASELGRVLGPVAADPMKLNEAIKLVRKFSLIRRNPESNMLSMHRLVQAVVRGTMAPKKERLWIERTMRAVNAAFSHVENGVRSQYEWLLPHAVKVAHLVMEHYIVNEEAWRLLYETASYLHNRARYSEAKPLYQQAFYISKQALGPEHLQVATTLFKLAKLCADQGEYGEAEPLYQRALRIREQQLGSEHPETAEILHDLARLWEM